MFYRCTHNNFGNCRCNGEPEWIDEGKEIKSGMLVTQDRNCKLNPETCGRIVKIEEIIDLKASWLEKPTYIETITPVINKTNSEQKKPKSAKVKKFEQEMAQKSLL